MYVCMYVCVLWYAGVAVQVLQQLREFDAPAMQSCKPLWYRFLSEPKAKGANPN